MRETLMNLLFEIENFIENKLRQLNQEIKIILLTNDSHDLICLYVENDGDRFCRRIKPQEFTLIVNAINALIHNKYRNFLIQEIDY